MTEWTPIAWCWNMPRANEPRWNECENAPLRLEYVRQIAGLARGHRAQPGCYVAQQRGPDVTYLVFKRVPA
jgi:hypothetical protein